MEYNHNLAMSNIHNVVVALNSGGMLTCNALMNRVWDNATEEQINSKINAARNASNRTTLYARKQLRQEIRRSLYTHFNDVEALGLYIYRATPVGSPEMFWVVEEQIVNAVEEPVVEMPVSVASASRCSPPVSMALIDRLIAANNSSILTSDLVQDSADNNFVNTDMPVEVCELLTEEFSEFSGLDLNAANIRRINDRVMDICHFLTERGE